MQDSYLTEPKTLVEHCIRLSIFELKKNLNKRDSGILTHPECDFKLGFRIFQGKSRLLINLQYSYINDFGEMKNLNYNIELVKSNCYFGNIRYWFVCPLIADDIPCKNRVAKLYKPLDREFFGCRDCHYLTYRSKNLSHRERLFARVTVAEQLGKSIKKWKYKGVFTKRFKQFARKLSKSQRSLRSYIYGNDNVTKV